MKSIFFMYYKKFINFNNNNNIIINININKF